MYNKINSLRNIKRKISYSQKYASTSINLRAIFISIQLIFESRRKESQKVMKYVNIFIVMGLIIDSLVLAKKKMNFI